MSKGESERELIIETESAHGRKPRKSVFFVYNRGKQGEGGKKPAAWGLLPRKGSRKRGKPDTPSARSDLKVRRCPLMR